MGLIDKVRAYYDEYHSLHYKLQQKIKLMKDKQVSNLREISKKFKKGSDVLIICEREDINRLFKEVNDGVKHLGNYGTFNNRMNKNKFQSVYIEGRTLHFGDEEDLENLIKEVSK